MNLLPDSAEYLLRRVMHSLETPGVDSYFIAWLLPDIVNRVALKTYASSICPKTGAQRTYQDVAVLGYAFECDLLDANEVGRLRDGLRWMTGRTTHLDGYPADFCNDGVSLLGISLGLRRLGDKSAPSDWVLTTCNISGQRRTDWQGSLISLAHHVSGAPAISISSDEVRLVASSKGLIAGSLDRKTKEHILERLRATELGLISDSEAPIRLAALKQIEADSPRISVNDATVTDVVKFLKGIPSGLQRWTWEDKPKTSKSQARKWYIDNEYHVQNLAWLLLSPMFRDARFEEYKSAVGSVHPRLDIVIPSLRLIVEVKFWRKGVKSEDMTRELAEDVGLYLTADAPYDQIVPLIWDEGARTEEHAALIAGLKSMSGIFDAVVISKPALMQVDSF